MAGRHAAGGRVGRRLKRTTETSDYVAFMQRIMATFGDRIAADPAALVHLRELVEALNENVNRGIFEANRSDAHYSQNDIASILGVSRQAIAKRIALGEAVYAEQQEARGAGGLVRIGDVRRRRAEGLAAAGVDDRTGSVRELKAAADGR